MNKRVFNIVRPREYPAGDGQVKTVWDRHGVLIVDGKKLSIHLDSVPVGEWNGWFNVFERENDQQAQTSDQGYQQQAPQYQPPHEDFDDDIPF